MNYHWNGWKPLWIVWNPGEATLEQSLEWFEEGMTLIKSCQDQLKHAEQKVQELIKNSKGDIIERDFE